MPLPALFPGPISIGPSLARSSPLYHANQVSCTHELPFESACQRHRGGRFFVSAATKVDDVKTSSKDQGAQQAVVPSQPISDRQSREVVKDKPAASNVPQVLRAPSTSDLDVYQLISSNSGSSLQATVCNIADSMIGSVFSSQQLKPSNDPKVQLSGNSAPVQETPPQRCTEVQGVLPPDLNGVYIRNGPNAARIYENGGYHMFDGDGMLHAVRIKDGTATYCSRYVRTSRFVQEEAARRPLFPKFFGGFYGVVGAARTALAFARAILGLIDVTEGWGLSNTSVGYFNGKVLSLSEDDMPYVLRVTDEGDLITVGKFQFSQVFKMNMCAHPKFDSLTGEMFAFSFSPSLPPFSFFRVSADGVKSPDVPIPLMDVPLIHDFAITKKYAIFPDNQFVMRPLEFLNGEMPIVCDKNKTSKFCILPRYATPDQANQALSFDVPGCNCFHYINAWDEGDEVVIIAPILSPPQLFLEIPAKNLSCTLSEVRLNTKTGSSSQRKICSGNFEFGTINQSYTGRKTRYTYLASGFYPGLTGVVKVDLQAGSGGRSEAPANGYADDTLSIVGRREFGENCYGNEPFFVARSTDRSAPEDEGYVLCLVHNEATGVSELLVMDAQSPSLELVASVKLPSRVPYGFHGWFVNEEQLAKQTAGV